MINNVILTGRITNDIELHRTNDGTIYTYFTLAVARRKGQSKTDTDFISCITWGKSAETMKEYLSKGSLIGVEGRLEVYRLEQNGSYQTRTNVNVSQFHFLETKKQNNDFKSESNFDYKSNFNNKNMNNFYENNDSQGPENDEGLEDIVFEDIQF